MLLNNSVNTIYPSWIEWLLPELFERATSKMSYFSSKLVVQSCSLRREEKKKISSGFSLIIKPVVLAEMGFIKILRRNINSLHCELFPTHSHQLKELVWEARQSFSAEQLSETVAVSKGMRIWQCRDQQGLSDSCSMKSRWMLHCSLELNRKWETRWQSNIQLTGFLLAQRTERN